MDKSVKLDLDAQIASTESVLSQLEALRKVQRRLKYVGVDSYAVATVGGFVLFAGEGGRHAISIHKGVYYVADGPRFEHLSKLVDSIVDFENDAAGFSDDD